MSNGTTTMNHSSSEPPPMRVINNNNNNSNNNNNNNNNHSCSSSGNHNHHVHQHHHHGKEDPNKYYQSLQRIEAHRRLLLRKSEHPAWKIICNWHGTILPIIVADPFLWLNLLLYVLIRVMSSEDGRVADFLKGLLDSDPELLKTIGNFLSFFLVFFVVQNNTRFCEMYEFSMAAKGNILSCASIARANLPEADGLQIVRHLNAAFAAGFVGLSDAYTYDGYFKEVNKTLILLNADEMERVANCKMDMGGSCYREIIQWVQIEINELTDSRALDYQTAKLMKSQLLKLQSNISQLYNYKDQPLIFFYIHLVVFVSVLYLPLFTIHSASKLKPNSSVATDLVTGTMIFLQSVFVIGLRELGKKLSDPFGMDYEDLSVMHYVTFTWRESARIMAAQLPLSTRRKNQNERRLSEKNITLFRAPIGEAWDLENTNNVMIARHSDDDGESFYDCQKTNNGD